MLCKIDRILYNIVDLSRIKLKFDGGKMSLSIAPLYSSSSGNSTFIGSENTGILIDAGCAGKYIISALDQIGIDPRFIKGILVTHEHSDHIKGVGIVSRKFDIPVYANATTWQAMEKKVGEISIKNRRIIDENDFFIDDLCISPIPLHHDAAAPTGYSIACKGKKISIITDTGRVTRAMIEKAAGSQVVLLEANHDVSMLKCGRYPYELKRRILSTNGHLSNEDCAACAVALAKSGVRGILLGHLSKENNFEELAYNTVAQALKSEGFLPGRDIALAITKKYEVTRLITI